MQIRGAVRFFISASCANGSNDTIRHMRLMNNPAQTMELIMNAISVSGLGV
jgi:hypothetical protein